MEPTTADSPSSQLSLTVRGGTVAAKLHESFVASVQSALAAQNVSVSYILSVQRAFPNGGNLAGIRRGVRLGNGGYKLFVCLPEEVLECTLTPEHTWNSDQLPELSLSSYEEMPPDRVPVRKQTGLSKAMRAVLQSLKDQFGPHPFDEVALVDVVKRHSDNLRSVAPVVANVFKYGYLRRGDAGKVQSTPALEEALTKPLKSSPKSKEKVGEKAGAKSGTPLNLADAELIVALRQAHGRKQFSARELANAVKSLRRKVVNSALGGYIAGLRKRGVLEMDGEGKKRWYRIASRSTPSPSPLTQNSGTGGISHLTNWLDEYHSLQQREEKLAAELKDVRAKLLSRKSEYAELLGVLKKIKS